MSSVLSREAVAASRSQALALLFVGFALWAVATVSLRLAGPALFSSGQPGRVSLLFAVTVPVMAMVSFAVYSLLDVEPDRRLTAAVLLVLPGMVFDAGVLTWFEVVFTPLGLETGPLVASVLLLAYATVLLTGLVPLRYADEFPTSGLESSTAEEPPSAEKSESTEESDSGESPGTADDATRF